MQSHQETTRNARYRTAPNQQAADTKTHLSNCRFARSRCRRRRSCCHKSSRRPSTPHICRRSQRHGLPRHRAGQGAQRRGGAQSTARDHGCAASHEGTPGTKRRVESQWVPCTRRCGEKEERGTALPKVEAGPTPVPLRARRSRWGGGRAWAEGIAVWMRVMGLLIGQKTVIIWLHKEQKCV